MDKEIKVKNIVALIAVILIAFLSGCVFAGLQIDNIGIKDLISPTVILFSATSATFMASRAIQNNRKSDRLKNTIDAIHNEIFTGENRVELEKACSILNEKLDKIGSFKAHCRLKTHAADFVSEFKIYNLKEFERIVDSINYVDKLCHGVDEGIYENEIINKFLGETVFDVWWASMVIIRVKELEYLDEIAKDYRKKPDFGRPYGSLYKWIMEVSDSQDLKQVKFVLGRLNTGYYNREVFREHENT